MADNIAITAGAGTSVATDDIGSVHYQRVKVNWGADGATNDTSLSADKGLPVQIVPGTTGGCSIYHKVAAANDNAANIKAAAGQIYGISVYNNAAYPVYVKFHNTAGLPTAGSGVVLTVGVQAGVWREFSVPSGLAFGTGIAITIIKDLADAGTTATAASDAVVDVFYK